MPLSDTQLLVLSRASQRPDGLVTMPPNLSGGAAAKVTARLIADGLLDWSDWPVGESTVYRGRSDGGGYRSLRITNAGFAAIGLGDDASDASAEATDPQPGDTETTFDQSLPDGDDAAGETTDEQEADMAARRKTTKSKKATRTARPKAEPKAPRTKAAPAAKEPRTPRSDTKQEQVLGLLRRQRGATVAAIMEATGWQQHTVRGFFAAVVRKKLGLDLQTEKADGKDRVYRIPAEAKAA